MNKNNLRAITNKQVRTDVGALVDFLKHSPVNFLAAQTACNMLDEHGFTKLDMSARWELEPGKGYYVTQNESAVFAWIMPGENKPQGFHIISAHTDSPCFRIKPNCEMLGEGRMLRLNTEVYGGPILYTWFDRPLGIAGRVILANRHTEAFDDIEALLYHKSRKDLKQSDVLNPICVTVDFKRPMVTIPHLAIHFNRAVNEGNALSKQKDMMPVVGRLPEGQEARGWLTRQVAKELGVAVEDILDFDLSLYDISEPEVVGPYGDFITSGRLDDLEMAFLAIKALTDTYGEHKVARVDTLTPLTLCPDLAESEFIRVAALFDNEETGSGTKQGAASPILHNILQRICFACGENMDDYLRHISKSFMISADNGHGLHPNYVEKQDPTNHPILGNGPVIKINANCKYMTDAYSSSVYAGICQEAGVPVQYFVNHSDVAGGSTLGNILTSQIPLKGVDMGAAIWAMHSCRETASTADVTAILRSFRQFFSY